MSAIVKSVLGVPTCCCPCFGRRKKQPISKVKTAGCPKKESYLEQMLDGFNCLDEMNCPWSRSPAKSPRYY